MLMFLASVLDQIDPALEHIQKGSVHDARLAWLQECLVSETGRKYLNDLSEARSGHFGLPVEPLGLLQSKDRTRRLVSTVSLKAAQDQPSG